MKTKLIVKFLLVILLFNITCERSTERRKIRLSNEGIIPQNQERYTSTIHFEEKERRSIAVLFFENLTGDISLEWLQKGLTEMLIRALAQSPSVSVLSTDRLFEISNRLGDNKTDIEKATIVAQEADIQTVLTGNFTHNGDSLRVNVKLHEPSQGRVLIEESVNGKGLENIFSMVDDLSQKIKNDLQLRLEKSKPEKGIAELTTKSLEAFKYYTSGLELKNKFLSNQAVHNFERAIELDADFIAAYLNLCEIYLNQREHHSAYQLFQKLGLLKNHATEQERYQINLLEARLKNDAEMYVSTVQEWLQNRPEDIDAHYNLVKLYVGWNNHEQAIHHLQNILKINDQYKLAYNGLGYQYAWMGNFNKAISSLKKYQSLALNEPNPYDSMAEIYFMYGDYENAKKYYKNALKINEDFMPSLSHLGYLYFEQGEYNKALKIFKENLEKTEKDNLRADALDLLARTYWRLGDYERAIDYFKQSLKINVFNFVAIEFLYEIYLEQNDSKKANQELQQIYSQVDKIRKSTVFRFNSIYTQAWLSVSWGINREQSIKTLYDEIDRSTVDSSTTIDEINLTNLKFFLTLLLLQTGRENEIDPLWEGKEVIPADMWTLLESVHNTSYSQSWRAFSILNTGFYRYMERGIEFYEPLIKYAVKYNSKSWEMMFRLFLADLYIHAGNMEIANQQLSLAGIPLEHTWTVIGPYDNIDGFRKKYLPEDEIELEKSYREKNWEVTWHPSDDDVDDGFINFKEIFHPYNWSVAYGLIYVNSPVEKKVEFRFGTDDGSKVWLNDREIWRLNIGGPAVFDDNKIPVTLQQGINKVLIKVCNGPSDWGFFFRVTDEEGNGVPGVEFIAAKNRFGLSESIRDN